MKFINILILSLSLIAGSTFVHSAELKQFNSIRAMIIDRADYSQERGTFKVLDFGNPPVIQLSTQIFPNENPSTIKTSTRRDIIYGIYKVFLHTPYQEISVVGVPVKFKTTSYVSKYQEKIRITKSAATQVAKNMLGVNSLRDLVKENNYDGNIVHTWSDVMGKANFNDQGSPGQNAFFNALKKASK